MSCLILIHRSGLAERCSWWLAIFDGCRGCWCRGARICPGRIAQAFHPGTSIRFSRTRDSISPLLLLFWAGFHAVYACLGLPCSVSSRVATRGVVSVDENPFFVNANACCTDIDTSTALFPYVGCASVHVYPSVTDGAMFDDGLGFGALLLLLFVGSCFGSTSFLRHKPPLVQLVRLDQSDQQT